MNDLLQCNAGGWSTDEKKHLTTEYGVKMRYINAEERKKKETLARAYEAHSAYHKVTTGVPPKFQSHPDTYD